MSVNQKKTTTDQLDRSAESMRVMADSEQTILEETLRLAGLRPTRQRVAIARLLLDGRHRHVSAESLSSEIQASGVHMADGTVYNTLNQFTNAGLLRRVTVHKEYSLFDTNVEHHHHFYDSDADCLIDIPADQVVLDRLPNAPDGNEIQSVDVIINIRPRR